MFQECFPFDLQVVKTLLKVENWQKLTDQFSWFTEVLSRNLLGKKGDKARSEKDIALQQFYGDTRQLNVHQHFHKMIKDSVDKNKK